MNIEYAKRTYKQLKLIHYAMTGSLVITGALFAVIGEGSMDPETKTIDELVLAMIPFLLLLATFSVSKVLGSMYEANFKADDPILTKMNKFQTSHIIQIALIEGPALFGGVSSLITGLFYPLIVTMMALLILLLKSPSVEKISAKLHFTPEELEQFN